MAGFGLGEGSPAFSPNRPRVSFEGSAAESQSDWDGLEHLMTSIPGNVGLGQMGHRGGGSDGYLNFGTGNDEFSQFQGLDFDVKGNAEHGNDIMY
mgnify:CR=1 FL=1|jgi:hypothetical protein